MTNTIPLTEAAKAEPKIKCLKIAGLVGRAIQSIHEETSVSKLFCKRTRELWLQQPQKRLTRT